MKFRYVTALATLIATGGLGAVQAQAWQSAGVPDAPAAWVDPCTTHVVLRRIANSQVGQGVYIPNGYKEVWKDDRLSQRRTHQTFAGKARMEQLWSNGVPRVQITRSRGSNAAGGYQMQCAQR